MGAEGVRLELLVLISQAKGQRIRYPVVVGFFVHVQSQTILYGLTFLFVQNKRVAIFTVVRQCKFLGGLAGNGVVFGSSH